MTQPTFKRLKGSGYFTKLFVPSTRNFSHKISSSAFGKRIKENQLKFSGLFGGSTTLRGVGSYVIGKKLIKERVGIIESSSSRSTFYKNVPKVLKLARKERKAYTQDTIGVEFDTPRTRKFLFLK